MANEGKVITINESDFSLSKSPFTQKKKPKQKASGGIKVKSKPKKKENTLKKRSIINMIRKHQKDRIDSLSKGDTDETDTPNVDKDPFNKDFNEAKDFLEQLTKQTEIAKPNKTIKKRGNHTIPTAALTNFEYENVSLEFPSLSLNTLEPSKQTFVPSNLQIKGPLYGCLKNGSLPTYKKYINQTRRVDPIQKQQLPVSRPITISEDITETLKNASAIRQLDAKLKNDVITQRPRLTKQKRTMRRTYKVGRSKTSPQVGVLISNKTLRNNISAKTHTLRQVSIDEVKKHLIKHGLIKVGSIAPNDVLRKMYESAMLICGEVQNHNPDNILHNFLNDH
uniref:Uncharacterized protein n=1 Tax=viral metagenome TaxID=1070528 RepID=A0A6C0I504_9ZZZZ